MRNHKAKEKAEELLKQIKFKRPPISQADIAKILGLTVRVGPLPDGLSGFLLRDKKKAIVGINSTQSKARQAFTFAHECGHYLLHPTGNFVDRAFVYYRNEKSAQGADKQEIEANAFAAELLMPESAVIAQLGGEPVDMEDDDHIQNLARSFGVSTQAFTYRLLNLHLNAR